MPLGILKNANCVRLKPVKFDKRKNVLTNTCAFDALLQMLCSSLCDSKKFADKLKSKPYWSLSN